MQPKSLPRTWQNAPLGVGRCRQDGCPAYFFFASLPSFLAVVGTGAGHFQREDRWFNRITDYLAQESPADTVMVEGVVDWHVPHPRWNQRVAYWLPWQSVITVAGRLLARDRHQASARELLEYARQRTSQLLGLTIADSNMDMLVGMLARDEPVSAVSLAEKNPETIRQPMTTKNAIQPMSAISQVSAIIFPRGIRALTSDRHR